MPRQVASISRESTLMPFIMLCLVTAIYFYVGVAFAFSGNWPMAVILWKWSRGNISRVSGTDGFTHNRSDLADHR